MLLRDHWYTAGPSSQVTDGAPYPFKVWNHDLVAFRDQDGVAKVLEDRCAHRGVPLSLGRVSNGNLACGYHGWEYDGAGVPVHIPSTGKPGPAGCRVASLPTVEADHYVWVWIAGRHQLPTFDPGIMDVSNHGWIQQTAIWETPVMPAAENQLDMTHTPFAHPGIYPGRESQDHSIPDLVTFEVDCRVIRDGVEAFGPPGDGADTIPDHRALGFWTRFELPYRNYVFLTREQTYAIYNWVPLSATSCRLEFMGRVNGPDGEPLLPPDLVIFQEDELELLGQDRKLLEGAAVRNQRRASERSVAGDAPQLLARRLVDHALAGKDLAETGLIGRRQIFTCAG